MKLLSRVWLFTTPWTVAYQAPPAMGFSRQEYWSGVPLPCPNLMLLCFYWLPNICKPTFFIFHGLQDPWLPGSSLAFKLCVCVCVFSCVQLFVTPWMVAERLCQALLSMEFFRQEYWSGMPFPPLGDLPDPGIESVSLASPELAWGFFTRIYLPTTFYELYQLYNRWFHTVI